MTDSQAARARRRALDEEGLLEDLGRLANRAFGPEPSAFADLVGRAQEVLDGESPVLRPRDGEGLPGGLLDLPDLPVLLLPDLHARADFLAAVLTWRPPLDPGGSDAMPTVLHLLSQGKLLLLCLGDAFHGEGQDAALRWNLAIPEYESGWASAPAMDEEMGRALACVELILRLKLAFPESFHYLKGNHDNVANEEGRGDHPFYKYAYEGEMTASWFAHRYGDELRAAYRSLELSLPVLARGRHFVASHAEPAFPLKAGDILEYRRRPDVVEALTWTPNDGALPGSVFSSLRSLLGTRALGSRWFGGHRPVEGRYALRQHGRYIQFHRPGHRNVVLLKAGKSPDAARDVLDLDPPSS